MSCFRTVILIFFLFIAGLRRMVKKTEHKNFGSQKSGLHLHVRLAFIFESEPSTAMRSVLRYC